MKGKQQRGHTRGLVKAIVVALGMALIGAYAMGWLNRDITVIGSDIKSAASKYLQLDESSSDILPDERPDLYYGEGRRDAALGSLSRPSRRPSEQSEELSYTMQQHVRRGAVLGTLRVTDGDVVTMGNKSYRLWGIDAPNIDQICNRYGRAWRCGQDAADALRELVQNKTVACYDKGVDRHGRQLGECFTEKINLSEWMAGEGWAYGKTAYTSTYSITTGIAQARNKGIWVDPDMRDPKRWNSTGYRNLQ